MIKSLTSREKIMLGALIAILVIVGYIKLIYEPIDTKVDGIRSEIELEQQTFDSNTASLVKVKKMKSEISKYKKGKGSKSMPVYDSSAELVLELEKIFANAVNVTYDFGGSSDITRTESYVKRSVMISFETSTYDESVKMIKTLHDSNHTNQIADVSMEVLGDNGKTETDLYVNFFESIDRSKNKDKDKK